MRIDQIEFVQGADLSAWIDWAKGQEHADKIRRFHESLRPGLDGSIIVQVSNYIDPEVMFSFEGRLILHPSAWEQIKKELEKVV
jgi:hypothetical protein